MKNAELHHVLNTAAKRLRMRQVARSASFCVQLVVQKPPTQTFLGLRHAIIPLPRDEPLRTFAWETRPKPVGPGGSGPPLIFRPK